MYSATGEVFIDDVSVILNKSPEVIREAIQSGTHTTGIASGYVILDNVSISPSLYTAMLERIKARNTGLFGFGKRVAGIMQVTRSQRIYLMDEGPALPDGCLLPYVILTRAGKHRCMAIHTNWFTGPVHINHRKIDELSCERSRM